MILTEVIFVLKEEKGDGQSTGKNNTSNLKQNASSEGSGLDNGLTKVSELIVNESYRKFTLDGTDVFLSVELYVLDRTHYSMIKFKTCTLIKKTKVFFVEKRIWAS